MPALTVSPLQADALVHRVTCDGWLSHGSPVARGVLESRILPFLTTLSAGSLRVHHRARPHKLAHAGTLQRPMRAWDTGEQDLDLAVVHPFVSV